MTPLSTPGYFYNVEPMSGSGFGSGIPLVYVYRKRDKKRFWQSWYEQIDYGYWDPKGDAPEVVARTILDQYLDRVKRRRLIREAYDKYGEPRELR